MASGSRYLVEWVHNWLLNFNVGKTHLFWFKRSRNLGALSIKSCEYLPEVNSCFEILVLSLIMGLDWNFRERD